MLLDPAQPDMSIVSEALGRLSVAELMGITNMMARYRNEVAEYGEDALADLFAALVDLCCAIRDSRAASLNRAELDLAGVDLEHLATAEPDTDACPAPADDQALVNRLAFEIFTRVRDEGSTDVR
jgi:hypothetical protein